MENETPAVSEDDAAAWISDVVQSIASLPEVRDRTITDEDIEKIARHLHRAPSYVRKAPRKDLLFLIFGIEQAETRAERERRSRATPGD